MTNPTFVTSENVKFDGTTQNAVVLKNSAGVRSLVLWDNLNAADQAMLTTFINAYGGTTPLAAPTAGVLTANFNGSVVGANATNLSNAANTAGTSTINVGGAKLGTDTTGLPNTTATFAALAAVDGKVITINVTGSAAQTFTTLVTELNADLGANATAALSGGNIVITSATTGLNSSVVLFDTGNLFSKLTGYTGITKTAGTAARVYTTTVTVDGVAKPISIVGSAAQTFTTLITELNADLGVAATAAIAGGNITITSATTGVTSTVTVVPGDLFRNVAGFVGFKASQSGAADLLAVFQTARTPAGGTFANHFVVETVGAKPVVPTAVRHTPAFSYYNGTVWKYLDDDTTINA